MLTKADERQLEEKGISSESALAQVDRFRKGFQAIRLAKAARLGDGILRLSEKEELEAITIYKRFEGSAAKFVPASGAASRMFKALFEFREKEGSKAQGLDQVPEGVATFFRNLTSFAFYEELAVVFEKMYGKSIRAAVEDGNYIDVVQTLLDEDGLGYGNMPKGLLTFHRYGEERRTPAIEQILEGMKHIRESDLHMHFTVSREFLEMFRRHIEGNAPRDAAGLKITYSSQEPATDKIAVDLNGAICRDESGEMLFRPAGHGALLRNLNRIEEDIVFIKNIDNVLPDHFKDEVVHFKKVIAGVLLKYQKRAFDLLSRHEQGEDILNEAKGLLRELGITGNLSSGEIIQKLDRPIRVCAMVENVGEPGGGPFWVQQKQGEVSLQIVEKAQINLDDLTQAEILESSTHFNPVDIVCGLKDRNGMKYDLMKFRDDETGFISEKSYAGKKLKAMELPGLWNGAMADWNTIFVEVPLATFSPVKTVNDLLKKEHQ